jgi:hypothetical protein
MKPAPDEIEINIDPMILLGLFMIAIGILLAVYAQ